MAECNQRRLYAVYQARLLKRALKLYAAHIIVLASYIVTVEYVSRGLHDPDDLSQFIAVFMSKPSWEFIQALLLRYRPVNLDILPLYVLLVGTFAPALWLMMRRSTLTLARSMAAYLAARHLGGISQALYRAFGNNPFA